MGAARDVGLRAIGALRGQGEMGKKAIQFPLTTIESAHIVGSSQFLYGQGHCYAGGESKTPGSESNRRSRGLSATGLSSAS